MGKVITITLRKGGSGKTTTAVNLASSLSKRGKKVLLIDLDAQANATTSLGIDSVSTPNIAEVLHGSKTIKHVINDPSKGFDLIPSNQLLSQVENTMNTNPNAYAPVITRIIAPIKDDYDYIIIDTAPHEGMLTVSALIASDYAIVPVQAHYLAMHGLQQALDLIKGVQDTYNAPVKVIGIVPTMVQTGTNMADLFLEQVRADYGELLLPYSIPSTIKVTESQLAGEPLPDYEPLHPASLAYGELAKHIIERY